MDEITAAVTPTSPPPAAPGRHSRAWLWLLLLVALAVGAFGLWQTWFSPSTQTANADAQRLSAQVDDLTHAVKRLRGNTDTLRARQDDSDQVDKSVRDQLLAFSERARLLEDSVANLADKHLSGHDAVLLDEAELLLTLGGERYALFHDAAATIRAYRAADTALSEVQDATFSTVRQSIAAEIAAFGALHGANPVVVTTQLAQLREQLAHLPMVARLTPAAAVAPTSRLTRLLGALVQVHHASDASAQIATHDAGLTRELAQLDLRDAQAAALARDASAYRAALADARAQLNAAADPASPAVAAILARIDSLSKSDLAPPPPDIVGSALKQLRNLRSVHALQATAQPTPKPVAQSAPGKPGETQK